MERTRIITFFFAVLLLFVSCSEKLGSRQEVRNYLANPDNGLHKEEKVGSVDIKLTYLPTELVVNEIKGKSGYKDRIFFSLSFSSKGKELLKQVDYSTYSTIGQVMAFRMGTFVSLVPGKAEPLAPLDCIFQQTYGMADANELLLVFDKSKIGKAKEFRVRIQEFGLGLGNITFVFDEDSINRIPQITI